MGARKIACKIGYGWVQKKTVELTDPQSVICIDKENFYHYPGRRNEDQMEVNETFDTVLVIS